MVKELNNDFSQISDWNAQTLNDVFQSLLQRREVGVGKVMAPLRLALTGLPSGPGIFDIAALLGKEETVARINKAIDTLPVNS